MAVHEGEECPGSPSGPQVLLVLLLDCVSGQLRIDLCTGYCSVAKYQVLFLSEHLGITKLPPPSLLQGTIQIMRTVHLQ